MPHRTDPRTLLALKLRHEAIAADRRTAAGRLGDRELTRLMLAPYPTLQGQRN
jgi:hypothetical protein